MWLCAVRVDSARFRCPAFLLSQKRCYQHASCTINGELCGDHVLSKLLFVNITHEWQRAQQHGSLHRQFAITTQKPPQAIHYSIPFDWECGKERGWSDVQVARDGRGTNNAKRFSIPQFRLGVPLGIRDMLSC